MTDQPTFEYHDEDGDDLSVRPMRGIPAVLILTGTNGIAVDLDRVEEVIAGIRDAARTAAAIDTGSDRAQHACTNCDGIDPASCLTNPGRAARQTTGQTGAWPLATPCGYCSHTRNWHMPKGRCQVKAGETGCGCTAFVAPDGSHPDPERPAVGQPAEAQAADEEAHPPRTVWRIEWWRKATGKWIHDSPSSDSQAGIGERLARTREYNPDGRYRLVRETTTWTVEDER